ncbi:hypothetical protein SUGI_1172240 [Cryptomeria japonica]|uniref:uncharacterized protein LOC131068273 n=1 Tax=Cryptomeria japonica TaxID=3369 RepID=UPI002414944C|nr:uncharacterized protein LOC131068273 [Cryptomeria japonica]GLJ54576.1 hypothetical protein SUGI_1172240 [Cryptomeria japonica]
MAEKRKRCSEAHNIAHKLESREIGNKSIIQGHSQIMFRNFELQEEFDTNQPSKIVQILSARSMIFALGKSGLCAAFDRHTNEKLCFLNLINPHEQILRLFHNKENNSLITISAHASRKFPIIKCRTTPLECIRRAQPDAGFALFEGEKLICPDSVKFDRINGKVLTFSAKRHIHKVFDMKSYKLLYSISDKEVVDIMISSGLMLLASRVTPCGSSLPLKILSIDDGKVLKSFHLALLPNKRVHFVDLIHDKIFVHQENEWLQMVDVQSEKMIELRKQEFEKPSALIFFHGKRLILTFHSGIVCVWNLQGEVVASYRNHLVQIFPGCIVHLTHDDELFLFYDKIECSINIINSLTGNCCAKIGGNDSDVGKICRNRSNLSLMQNTVQDIFENITALCYDEERNEIYTGNKNGFIHAWSN